MRIDRASRALSRPASLCLTLWCAACSGAMDSGAGSQSDAGETGLRRTEPTRSTDEPAAPTIHAAAHDERTRSPADATPSPDGTRVYYVALGRDDTGEDRPGVFSVAADGGAPQTLASGAPFAYPVNIATSLDGQQLFVADRAAGDRAQGALLALGVDNGTAQIIDGTQNYRPGGLTVRTFEGREQVLFSGIDPERGSAGLFAIAPTGGAVQTLASGDAFHEPSGVAAATDGTAYVVDIADGSAQVLRVRRDRVEPVLTAIGVGFPAGIALTRDEKTLLVSGIDVTTRHDVVHVVDLASGRHSQWTQGISAFAEAAGLHRAHDRDVFAWADSQADRSGTVYVLEP